MKGFLFFSLLILSMLFLRAQEKAYDVTFNVDMLGATDYPCNFNPNMDTVYIATSFTDWSEPGSIDSLMLIDSMGYMQYSLTIKLINGEYYYKYFINSGWEKGEWAGEPNRIILVNEANISTNDFFGGVADTFDIHVATININQFEIFPNPAIDFLNIEIELHHSSNVVFRIFDLMGKEVANKHYENVSSGIYQSQLNVKDLSQGMYILQIDLGHESVTNKIQVLK